MLVASRLAIFASTRRSFHCLGLRPATSLRLPLARSFASNKEKHEDEEEPSSVFSGKTKDISLRESKMIFGIEDASQMNVEFIKKKWTLLKKNNDPDKGGSMYLLQKIINAKKRLARQLQVDLADFNDPEADPKKPGEKEEEKPNPATQQEPNAEEKKSEPQAKQ